uniref:Uncharacterized protein n=1 Tax=Anguilla anguilla TaxID=7936 RepID=A0A0E9R150_ANGAN
MVPTLSRIRRAYSENSIAAVKTTVVSTFKKRQRK